MPGKTLVRYAWGHFMSPSFECTWKLPSVFVMEASASTPMKAACSRCFHVGFHCFHVSVHHFHQRTGRRRYMAGDKLPHEEASASTSMKAACPRCFHVGFHCFHVSVHHFHQRTGRRRYMAGDKLPHEEWY